MQIFGPKGIQEATILKSRSLLPQVCIETLFGPSLTCGLNCEIMLSDGSIKPADHLRPGDKVALANIRKLAWEEDEIDFEWGWLLGQIVGDGGHNPTNSGGTYVRFYKETYDHPSYERADLLVRSLGARSDYGGGNFHSQAKDVTLKTAALGGFADQFIFPKSKDFRASFFSSSYSFKKGFLQGIFDTDGTAFGSIAKGRAVRLNQSNLDRMKSIQLLLLSVGLTSKLYRREDEGPRMMPDGKGGQRQYITKENFDLHMSGANLNLFKQRIGFFNRDKSERLARLIQSTTRPPYQSRFEAEVSATELTGNLASIGPVTTNGDFIFANGFLARL